MMDLRAVAYQVGGPRIGVLPDTLGITLTVPRVEAPTVDLTYPAGSSGVRGGLLDRETEVAIEHTFDGQTWVEAPGARFVSHQADRDLLDDGTTSRRLHAIHVSHLLDEVRVWHVPEKARDKDGKYKFLSASAGVILRTLWDAAVRRGWGAGLTLECTPSTDSASAGWRHVVTLAFDPSLSLAAVARSLVNLGLCDIEWAGRTMRVLNPDGALARRRPGVLWPLHQGATTAAPESTSWADLCTHVLVKGEGGRTWQITNPAAPQGLRRIERVVEAGGVEEEATARLVARTALETGSAPAEEVKREWRADGALLLPWRDYLPGDWISVERTAGRELMRVAQVSVTRDADGVAGHTTFGTRLDDVLSRLAKRTKGIVGGASTSGSGVRPAPPGQDTRTPAAPQGLVARAETIVLEDGGLRGVLQASWDAVTTATDATAMEIDSYDVYVRRAVDGAPWHYAVNTRTTNATFNHGAYSVGDRVEVGIRARGRYTARPGQMAVTSVTVPPPQPLDQPTRPLLTVNAGMVSVQWDGRLQAPGGPVAPPSYLDHLEAQEAPGTDGPWTPVGRTPDAPVVLDRQDRLGRTYWYRWIAVDTMGRRSQPSAPASILIRSEVAEKADKAASESRKAHALAQEQARKVGTLEGSVTGLQNRLTAAEEAAQDAKRTAQGSQTAADQARQAAAAAEQAAQTRSREAQQAAQAYAEAQANAAKAAAIAAASQDATAKDNALKAAAEATARKAAADAAAAAQKAAEAKAADARRAADAAQVAADAAKAQAAQAKTSADAATRLASGADTKAGQAQAAATAATSQAASAQAKASEAATKALAAQAEADAAKASAAQAVRDAAADAQRKADAAREAAKTYAKAQADAAKAAARAEASTDAQAKADAAKAAAVAAAALDAKKKADAAQRAAEAKAEEAKRAAQTAQARADQAAREAVEAKRTADAASAKALGAQSTADAAAAKATTADGRYTVAVADPATRDGAGKPAGAVWEVRSGAISLRRFVWDGKAWVKVQAGQDFIGPKAIGRAQIADAAVGTLQVADGSITNAKIGSLAVDKLDVVGGGRFKNAVVENLLGTSAFLRWVRTERVVVAAESLFPNSLLHDQDQWTWSSGTAKAWGTDPEVSGHVLTIEAARAQKGAYYQPSGHPPDSCMVLKPGRTYRVSAMVRFMQPAVGSSGQASIYLRYRKTDGGIKPLRILPVSGVPTKWKRVEEQFTLPADAKSGLCTLGLFVEAGLLSGKVQFAEVRVEEAAGSTLIEPGGVTAPAIAAGAVTAGKLSATAIDGMVITGATVRTAASGSRVEMSRSGLRAINRRGEVTVSIDGERGHFTGVTLTGGKVQTAVSGTRTVLEGVGLTMYGGDGQRTTTLDPSGTTFWLGNDPLGQFGRTTWADKPTTHGIAMRLNYRGRFITWGYEESPNSPHYTAMLTLDPKGEVYGAPGINISAPITCGAQQWEGKYWQRLHFGKTTIGGWDYPALMQTDNKVGIAFGTTDMHLIVGNTAFSVMGILRKLNYAI